MRRLIDSARRVRWTNVVVANLRIFIGFAFVPAGLKKVLDQPFTDPGNTGTFHEFLHAFHDTGVFYQFVGVMQLCAALLLCSQRFATLGALLMLPIIAAITVFCWSTAVYPTAAIATLILAGILTLIAWDYHKWWGIFAADDTAVRANTGPLQDMIDLRLWRWCGLAVFGCYVGLCVASGGVYRPRGMEPSNPAFYVFPAMLALPVVTLIIDQRRYRARRESS